MSKTSEKPRMDDTVQDNQATISQDFSHEKQGKTNYHRPEKTGELHQLRNMWCWVVKQTKNINSETDKIQINLECG